MRNYILKLYLEDGSYGYYRGIFSGAPYITDDTCSCRLYDTGTRLWTITEGCLKENPLK